MATGEASSPMSLNSMTRHLPAKCRPSSDSLRGQPCSLGDRPACPVRSVSAAVGISSHLGKLYSQRLGWSPMSTLRTALAERVVVADGAIGTMLQASTSTIDDFAGHEGCNEILNVTRPDAVTEIHEAYLDAGADCVTTNSFGANLGNLGEYGIADRIAELSEASARLARAAADRWATPARPRWVLGSIGPGTEAAHARSHDVPRATRHLPGQRGGPATGRRGRADHRDLPGPASGQSRHHRVETSRGQPGPGRADHRAGHD